MNPFLAVLGLIVLIQGFAWVLTTQPPPLAIPLIIPLALLPHLIHFHCLDCGQTGRYTRRDHHACPNVVARWDEDRSSRFLSGQGQLILWCWILGSIGILITVAWQ